MNAVVRVIRQWNWVNGLHWRGEQCDGSHVGCHNYAMHTTLWTGCTAYLRPQHLYFGNHRLPLSITVKVGR